MKLVNMRFLRAAASLLAVVLLSEGCATTGSTGTAVAPRVPDMRMRVATLNLSTYSKRIERKEVDQLAALLKREQVDILSVQGITRYPSVPTRVDFVEALSRRTDMRSAFGESVNNLGRQIGNAVFTMYTLRSHSSLRFENVKSAESESALQTVIDGGVHEISVVSATFPPKATAEEQELCITAILEGAPASHPMIVAGNMPGRPRQGFFDAVIQATPDEPAAAANGMWASPQELLEALSSRKVSTAFGELIIVEFGLFRSRNI